jgi:hypothetical protein
MILRHTQPAVVDNTGSAGIGTSHIKNADVTAHRRLWLL